jgi:hypothetical protein
LRSRFTIFEVRGSTRRYSIPLEVMSPRAYNNYLQKSLREGLTVGIAARKATYPMIACQLVKENGMVMDGAEEDMVADIARQWSHHFVLFFRRAVVHFNCYQTRIMRGARSFFNAENIFLSDADGHTFGYRCL